MLKNFKYVTILHDDEGDRISFAEDELLYSLDELSPEKPFAVSLIFLGLIPNRGISFTDENNITRYFTISLSGKGETEYPSILVVEYFPSPSTRR